MVLQIQQRGGDLVPAVHLIPPDETTVRRAQLEARRKTPSRAAWLDD